MKEIADDDAENNPPSDVGSDSSGESEDVDRDDDGGDAEAGGHQEADLQSGEGSEDDVDESDEESHIATGFTSVECAAHALQCSLQAGLSVASIQRLLKAAKKIVQHFHQSSLASEALRRKQRENNKPEKACCKSALQGGTAVLQCWSGCLSSVCM